jgi:hypothetical protein
MTIVRGASKEDDDISWLPAASQREKKTRVCKGARYVWALRCYMLILGRVNASSAQLEPAYLGMAQLSSSYFGQAVLS